VRYLSLAATVWLAVVALTCAKKDPAKPVRPFVDIHDGHVSVATASTDPRGEILKYIFEFGDGTAETTGYHASGETAWCRLALLDTGTYRICALARNVYGLESQWSDTLVYCQSQPPTCRPDTTWFLRPWGRNRWYRFTIAVSDSDGDSVAAKFIWGDGSESGWTPFVSAGSTIADSVQYVTDGDYYPCVILNDSRGTLTEPDTIAGLRVTQIALLWWNDWATPCASLAIGCSGGQTLVYGNENGTYCWDRFGRIVWSNEDFDAFDYPPVLNQAMTRLYVEDDLALACLDAITGSEIWRLSVPAATGELWSPLVMGPDGELYYGPAGVIVRVKDCGSTASVEWQLVLDVDDCPTGFAIREDGIIYAAIISNAPARSDRLMALRPDGSLLWCDSVTSTGKDIGCPAVDGQGRMLVADNVAQQVCCLNADGSRAWLAGCAGTWASAPSVAVGRSDMVYVGSDDGTMCFDATGQSLWRANAPSEGGSPCVLSDGSVLVWDGDTLTCIATDGETQWAYSVVDTLVRYWPLRYGRGRPQRDWDEESTSPVVDRDGNVYFSGGELCCLSLGSLRLADSPWPTYCHDAARSGWAGRR
jgi:hypothetical protein